MTEEQKMQVSVETTQGLERRMTVQVPADRVDSEVDKRLQKVGRTAKLKGFRPGKAPMNVIRQQYGPEVRREVLGEVMQESYLAAIGEQELSPAGGPKIEADETGQGKDLQFTAVFEVYPEIRIKGLDKIKIKRPTVDITDEDVASMLDNLRRQRADWAGIERGAGDGDRVTVSFVGTIDGEAFEGGTGNDVQVVCGEGQMLPDFENGLKGIITGDSRIFSVQFPDDYHASDLAGKIAEFDTQCSMVEERVLPEIDDEFCTAYGVSDGGVEALRVEVRNNMQTELDQRVRAELKKSLLDSLFEANPVDLPTSLVDEEIHSMQHEAMERMGTKDHSQAPPAEAFVDQARRRVSLGLLISEVIRDQELKVDKDKVRGRLDQIAASYGDPEQVIKAYGSNPGMMNQIEMMVLEEQVVDWLLEQVKQVDEKKTFSDVMNFKS